MRHSPTHEEIHDKSVATPRRDRAATGGARHRWSSGQHRRPARRPAAAAQAATARAARRAATTIRPVLGRVGPALKRPAGKVVMVAAAIGCLALAAAAQGASAAPSLNGSVSAQLLVRADQVDASRSAQRSDVPVSPGTAVTANAGSAVADARVAIQEAPLTEAAAAAKAAADAQAAAVAAAQAQAAAQAKAAADAKWKADNPTPVAGLTQAQMNNALRIVGEGKALGLPKQAYVLAVACAMQESQLYNLASWVLPESMNYPHEGSGGDHDSVGLFQQRPSSGWGTVKDIMTPAYAAKQFYEALISIPGWQNMALTYAIQTVQVSAYPDAYAPHEAAATAVVDALTR